MKFNLKKAIFLSLVLSFLNLFSSAKNVILWDFGGIIFNPNKIGVAMVIGPKHFLSYMLMDFSNPNIQNVLFEFLSTMMNDKRKYIAAGTAEGTPLPLIMCHWQAGTITGPHIIKMANEHIKKMDKIGYFSSIYEKTLIKRTINAIFDPKILAKNVYPLKEGVELLKKCASARNPDGTKKNRNIAFSNWDPLSFKAFRAQYEEIFKYFDDIVISGDIGLIKPHKRAYRYILNKLNLDSAKCLLVDDQRINAKGAEACGIKTILLKNWDYNQLEHELKYWGVL